MIQPSFLNSSITITKATSVVSSLKPNSNNNNEDYFGFLDTIAHGINILSNTFSLFDSEAKAPAKGTD